MNEESTNPVEPKPAEGTPAPESGAAPEAGPGPEGGAAPEGGPTTEYSEAWRGVVVELDALGTAISRWAKAAVNDPDNRRRLDELSSRLNGFVTGVRESVKGVSEGEVGESFRDAAEATGEAFRQAGERISEEVGPHLASAFKFVGEKLRTAAEHIEEKAAPAEPQTTPPGEETGPSKEREPFD